MSNKKHIIKNISEFLCKHKKHTPDNRLKFLRNKALQKMLVNSSCVSMQVLTHVYIVCLFVCNWRDILMSRRAPNEEAMPIANANQSSIAPEQVKADPN